MPVSNHSHLLRTLYSVSDSGCAGISVSSLPTKECAQSHSLPGSASVSSADVLCLLFCWKGEEKWNLSWTIANLKWSWGIMDKLQQNLSQLINQEISKTIIYCHGQFKWNNTSLFTSTKLRPKITAGFSVIVTNSLLLHVIISILTLLYYI